MANQLKKIRTQLQLTQRMVATTLQIPLKQYRYIENECSYKHIEKRLMEPLCDCFQEDMIVLFGQEIGEEVKKEILEKINIPEDFPFVSIQALSDDLLNKYRPIKTYEQLDKYKAEFKYRIEDAVDAFKEYKKELKETDTSNTLHKLLNDLEFNVEEVEEVNEDRIRHDARVAGIMYKELKELGLSPFEIKDILDVYINY